MFVLNVTAHGRPRSKGSHVAQVDPRTKKVRAAAVQEDDLSRWERTVRSAASGARSDAQRAEAWPLKLWYGPVLVLARFRLVRPKRLAETMDAEPALVVPDLDKIVRALLDGLSGVAYADDKQVIGLVATKGYASPLERPGVSARVCALDEGDPWQVLREQMTRWTG